MTYADLNLGVKTMWLRGFLAGSIVISALTPSASQTVPGSTPAVSSASPLHRQRKLASSYRSKGTSIHEEQFYQFNWGVDSFVAKSVEAGQMIRFSYRVVDAEKAKALNDKKAAPSLIDMKAHVQLVVPSMEKIGQLRQSSNPEAGKTYWMVFSNKGRLVKHGDRVSVVIGRFHADGLVVD